MFCVLTSEGFCCWPSKLHVSLHCSMNNIFEIQSLKLTSSSAQIQKIPTVVNKILLTHFGGFVLLITLLHYSLHTLYGHVLPWICRHWESLSISLLAILFMKLIIFQIVQWVNSFLFNFFLEFGGAGRIRTYNVYLSEQIYSLSQHRRRCRVTINFFGGG